MVILEAAVLHTDLKRQPRGRRRTRGHHRCRGRRQTQPTSNPTASVGSMAASILAYFSKIVFSYLHLRVTFEERRQT